MNTLEFCYFPTKGYPPSSMSSLAERFINLGPSPTQKPLRVVGRLRTGESESARGTMGRGKSGREAPVFSFFPSSIARSLFLLLLLFIYFFFLLFIFFKCCYLYQNTQRQPLRRKASLFRAVNTFRVVRLGYVTECFDREGLGKRRTVKRERERDKAKKGFLSK